MTQDEIIEMGIKADLCDEHGTINLEYGYLNEIVAFAKLVAQHEREACAYWAGIALLGADRGLSNRVDQAIRARGYANDTSSKHVDITEEHKHDN